MTTTEIYSTGIENLSGCEECVEILLIELAGADFNLTALTEELANVLVHANDTARLNVINESVQDLRVK